MSTDDLKRASRARATVEPDTPPPAPRDEEAERAQAAYEAQERALDAAWERAYPSIRRAGGATPDGKRPKGWKP